MMASGWVERSRQLPTATPIWRRPKSNAMTVRTGDVTGSCSGVSRLATDQVHINAQLGRGCAQALLCRAEYQLA